MNKKSLGGRLSANPVRISLIEKEDRRRTQTLKSGSVSSTDETHIPRPRIRSSSVEATGRKSSLKPPARVQHSQYGYATPQATAPTPSTSGLLGASGSSIRARSPSAERASAIASKLTRKDNRPLGEKSFQTEMLSKIDSYLRSIDQSSLLNSNGSIKPITLKMFVEISDLLVKLLDIKQSLTMTNYVEELPKIGKKLHYPGQINKSWLKTANAMHSWPQVLGWLSWLVETCAVRDLAAEHFQLDDLPFVMTDNTTKELVETKLMFLMEAYKLWNEEKADEEAAVTKAYLNKVASMQGVSEIDIANAQAEYESESLLLEDAKAKGAELDEELKQLEEKLKSLRNREIMQEAHIKELEDAESTYLTESKVLDEETKVLQETYKQQKIRQEELKVQINSQPMSITERDEIIERCGDMQNQMRELDKHINDINKELYTLDLKLASIRTNLNKVVFAYNKDIYLHLDKEADIDLYDIAMPVTGISNPDVMEELERKAKTMDSLRENMEKKNKNMKAVIEADKKELEIMLAKKIKLESEKEEQLAKINEKKNHIKTIQDAAKAKETELTEAIENLKRNIKDMEDRMPNIEQEEMEITEAKEKIEALNKRKDYLQESARLFFDKFFETLSNHKNRLDNLFRETEEPE